MPGAIDYEIGKRLHPEPPTEEELENMKDIEPTSAGIFLHKLQTITSEGNGESSLILFITVIW